MHPRTKLPSNTIRKLVPGKKFYDALRCVVAEKSLVVPGSLFGNRCAARKQSLLILLKCRLNITKMYTEGLSQFSSVIDCEVGSLTPCARESGDASAS